jgi:hypothetical protein
LESKIGLPKITIPLAVLTILLVPVAGLSGSGWLLLALAVSIIPQRLIVTNLVAKRRKEAGMRNLGKCDTCTAWFEWYASKTGTMRGLKWFEG